MSDTKLLRFEGNFDKYSTDENPTKNSEMQDYMNNQNKVMKDFVDSGLTWQSETEYALGDTIRLKGGLNARCIQAGISGLLEPTWFEGQEIIDGGAKWFVSAFVPLNAGAENAGAGAFIDSNGRVSFTRVPLYIRRNTEYSVGEIVYSPQLTAGKVLKCTVAGTTAATEPEISGATVEDGTATFEVTEMGGGGSGNTWGIEPNPVTHRHKDVDLENGTVTLRWRTGQDAVTAGYTLARWYKDIIVKKHGSLPQSPIDGILVCESYVRDEYAENGFVDIQANGNEWYYRAFPMSEGNIYSRSRLNDFQFYLFGIRVDKDNPDMDGRVEALQGTDAYFYTKPKMDFVAGKFNYGGWGAYEHIPFAPKPCMLKWNPLGTGDTVDYYLDIDDKTKKIDGTASDYGDSTYAGNAMAEFNLVFRKVYTEGRYRYTYLCSEKLDDDFRAWPFLKQDGTYNDHFYLALDECQLIESKLRCIGKSGQGAYASQGAAQEMTSAEANGTGYEIWTESQLELLQSFYEVFFMSHDSENSIGIQGSSTSGLLYIPGSCKDKGMFYGTKGNSNLVIFGIEGAFGHRWKRIAGLICVNYAVKYKLTWHIGDGSGANGYNLTGDNYLTADLTIPQGMSSSWIKDMWGQNDLCYIPKEVGGSATTYYADGAWSASGTTMLLFGGYVNNGSLRGPFAWLVDSAPGYAAWNCGAALSYTPR